MGSKTFNSELLVLFLRSGQRNCRLPLSLYQKWTKKLQITIITLLTHCLFFIDIIYREILKKYSQVNKSIDICLHSLSQVLAKARGSNTINLYTKHFSKWQQWVSQFPNTKAIPADDTYVIAYMLNLFQKLYRSCSSCQFRSK